MTASPERTDSFDVYEAFDHNIAYEIRLQQALEENLLCPFHYFGITDLQIEGETVEVVRMPLHEALRLIESNEIKDAKTIIALLKYRLLSDFYRNE